MQCIGRIFCIPPFLVAGTIYHAADLRPSQCSGTHHAGFYRNVEGAVFEIFSSQHVGSRSDCLHFGMSRNVGQHLRKIVGTRYDPVLTDDDGAYRNLVFIECCLSLHQGTAHVYFVFILIIFHCFSCKIT